MQSDARRRSERFRRHVDGRNHLPHGGRGVGDQEESMGIRGSDTRDRPDAGTENDDVRASERVSCSSSRLSTRRASVEFLPFGTRFAEKKKSSSGLDKRAALPSELHKCNFDGGGWSAPLHPMAGTGKVPGLRSRDLLPREGRIVAGGETDLCRLRGPYPVPELRAAPRRAVRRVGRDERTGKATPEAYGVLNSERR
jgi:hypothetical protein